MRWSAAVPFSILLITACTSLSANPMAPAAQSPALEQPFTLKPGDTISIGVERVQVKFDRVVADSRCPRDVQCIQAGEAVVRALVTLPGKSREQVDVKTTPNEDRATVGGYVLTLTALEPLPLAAKPTRASDYRATFVLTKAR